MMVKQFPVTTKKSEKCGDCVDVTFTISKEMVEGFVRNGFVFIEYRSN